MAKTLDLQVLKDPALHWARLDVQCQVRQHVVALRLAAERAVEPLVVSSRLVRLESMRLPVALECPGELLDEIRVATFDSRTFHSSPSISAVWDRFDEPMNAVE